MENTTNKKLSLDDIIGEKAKKVEERVEKSKSSIDPNERRIIDDVSEIRPMSETVNNNKAVEEYYYKKIDDAIERTKKAMYEERIKPYQDACKALAEEAEFNGEDDVKDMNAMIADVQQGQGNLVYDLDDLKAMKKAKEAKEAAKNEPVIELDDTKSLYRSDIKQIDVSNNSLEDDMLGGQGLELDMADFDDELTIEDSDDELDKENKEDDEAKRLEDEANQKRLVEQIRSKVQETTEFEKLDLTKFTVGGNKVSINATMNRISRDSDRFTKTESVPLYETGRVVKFTPLTGSDIVKMSSESYDSRLESLQKTYSVLYNHDATVNKSTTSFTSWLKTIAAGDIFQMYFGAYKSTFSGSNYIAYKCDECDNFFMVKRDMKDMYSINPEATEEQKKRLRDIEEFGEVEDNLANKTELYQVSENYAILIHPRTLYNTLEIEYLDAEFRRKYAAIVQPMQYIDQVYYIDKERNRLIPVDMHTDKSIVKTIKNKCIIIHKMISAISTDQYSMLTGKLATLSLKEAEASNMINYHVPSQECLEVYSKGEKAGQKCHHVIEEEEMTPYAMLFTRHQLYINTTLTV